MAKNDAGVHIKIYSSGFAHVEDFVIPFVKSVMEHEPTADLTIVDNGSPDPYPSDFLGVPVVRTDNLAILTSFNKAIGDADFDWLIITDTDVLCDGPFLSEIAKLDPSAVYGRQMFHDGDLSWCDSWFFIIPRQIWDKVGKFDEDFLLTGAFQDLDYCLRVQKAGFKVETISLPLQHIGANTTHKSPQFWENREYNKRLVEQKHWIKLGYK